MYDLPFFQKALNRFAINRYVPICQSFTAFDRKKNNRVQSYTNVDTPTNIVSVEERGDIAQISGVMLSGDTAL